MKVILDANIYLSYLLAPDTHRTITSIIDACFTRPDILLFVPNELIGEIERTVRDKGYFRERVVQEVLHGLIQQLRDISTVPAGVDSIAPISRDQTDDYLLAYAIAHDVDFLVTGDPDLLILKGIDRLRIVKPSEFLNFLEQHPPTF